MVEVLGRFVLFELHVRQVQPSIGMQINRANTATSKVLNKPVRHVSLAGAVYTGNTDQKNDPVTVEEYSLISGIG